VITYGALVQRSLLAAQQAEKDGISVMVVDLRTIMPYDWQTITAAVMRTNRVVIAHEDQLTCGFGAELAARMATNCSNTSMRRSGASPRSTHRSPTIPTSRKKSSRNRPTS
jgi:pyruvate/2-oxoglutarate/acetoin dehydrogenase E1 component